MIAPERTLLSEFAADVGHYLRLTPRQLPSRYLYDALGSALFDAICELPWYGITRAEERLLRCHRNDVFARVPGTARVVELGPGNGHKLRTLIGGARRQEHLTAHLIDLSANALANAERTLAELENVSVTTHQASFEAGLDELRTQPRRTDRSLVLFLGSNIGNFDPPAAAEFLARIRRSMMPDDALLLGADLVKPERELLLAYDDPLGVSAAFNRNLLVRVNRELGADFDLDAYEHRAVWNASLSRVEMYLVARRAQRVRVEAADLDFDLGAGESIWTESSYKYQAEDVTRSVEAAAFRRVARWIDGSDQFALLLFQAV